MKFKGPSLYILNTINMAKRKPMEWETIFSNHVSVRGFISMIYKVLLQLNNSNKTPQTTPLKMGKRINGPFSKEDTQMANKQYSARHQPKRLLWKTVWHLLKQVNIGLSYDLAMPLPGTYPQKIESKDSKDICTPTFIAASVTVAEMWTPPKHLSVDGWIHKRQHIHTKEYDSVLEKKDIHGSAWVAQSAKCPTLGFSSGHDLPVS